MPELKLPGALGAAFCTLPSLLLFSGKESCISVDEDVHDLFMAKFVLVVFQPVNDFLQS